MLMPKRAKHRKVQRGRMTGAASRGNKDAVFTVGNLITAGGSVAV